MLQAVLSPEQSYLTREVMEKLHEAVGELDPAQQELLSLFYVQELEQKDIAVLFDISVQTVKMRLFHIRAKLKKSLRLHHPDLFAKVGE